MGGRNVYTAIGNDDGTFHVQCWDDDGGYTFADRLEPEDAELTAELLGRQAELDEAHGPFDRTLHPRYAAAIAAHKVDPNDPATWLGPDPRLF